MKRGKKKLNISSDVSRMKITKIQQSHIDLAPKKKVSHRYNKFSIKCKEEIISVELKSNIYILSTIKAQSAI